MKQEYIIFTILLCIIFSCSPSNKCDKFHYGTFVMYDSENDTKFLIERFEEFQVEKNLKTNNQSRYKIEWINSCSYNLILQEGENSLMNSLKNKILRVNLLDVQDDSYFFEMIVDNKKINSPYKIFIEE